MDAIVGVGVPRHASAAGGWDLWLPFYMVLTIVLLRVVGRLRVTIWTSAAAFVAGTLWAWSADVFGVVQAGGTAFLFAVALGEVTRRLPRPHPGAR